MKNLLFLAFLVPLFVHAETINKSTITDVTVYQSGAKITNEANISLKPGNNVVVISDITTSINANSVQVRLSGSAVLLSATTRVRKLEDENLPHKTKVLTDSLLMLEREISWLKNQKEVYEGESKLILSNQKLGTNEEKATVDEIIKLSEFYRSRLMNIKKTINKIDNDVTDRTKEKQLVQKKLNELKYSEKKSVGEIVLTISSKVAGKVKAQISYMSYQAGWSPIYDVRASGTDKPVTLIYKANVRQTTGYSWDKVNLVVSTGDPTANNTRPTMYPWYVDFYYPQMRNEYKSAAAPSMKKMSQTNALQRSMVMESEMVMDQEDAEYDEIAYEVVKSENSIAAEYSIEVDQDIPSDGKLHLVAIQEYELNSTFSYHAIPKLNKSAFLLAKVADYGSYNLLPGQTNLFFDGMYIGQSYLNPVTTVDSMLLSLGRDEKIIVKRSKLKDLTARQSIGANIKETKAFEISIRNNNNYAIEMDLMDQVPIAQNKEIEIKLEDAGGAKYDQDYGSLLWKLKIKAGETKKVKFIYSAKYPKDKTVSGL